MAFFQNLQFVFQIPKSQKNIFQKTILSLKFKFQAQDSFLKFFFFFEIWRSEKNFIALSEKKQPLVFDIKLSTLFTLTLVIGWDATLEAILSHNESVLVT